jgi:ADP-ribosylglycohydrolase
MMWLDAIAGVVTGDALGCPVQFMSREEIAANPVTGMRGYGTFGLPEGSWTDDSSLTLAALYSIAQTESLDPEDIMKRFVRWYSDGEYTPYGYSFDIGFGTSEAIENYMKGADIASCGGNHERNNGNGSLMRIMPACLYCIEMQRRGEMTDSEAVAAVHTVSALTHAHLRSKIACGLYYFAARSIANGDGTLIDRLQKGLDEGFVFYKKDIGNLQDLSFYGRLSNLYEFINTDAPDIRSSGYVVHSLEAAVWCLIKTNTLRDALLTAVNLGEDTDTVGAICGGLAGLYYGYEDIPEEWLAVIKKRDEIEEICRTAEKAFE